ncbi:MAG TPA: protein kinase, partial [Polyangiaceae bacterium]|nr:protein kinase [Polyangiaceae bacterium]
MAAPRREDSATVTNPEGLGPYWLLERMAEGRLGPVHRACLRRDGKPDKLLVLKRVAVSIAAEPGFSERFSALMSEVANVVHPALCTIEDVGNGPEGELYVAVEHVIGRDLGRIHAALAHRGQALPPALVVYVANQVADALAAAHRATRGGKLAPLFHGELALSEILIGYDGSVRLTGLGSHALESLVPGLAPRGNRAPELERSGSCDARSDVYSLGACMYELLTGGPALRGSKFSAEAPLPRPQSHIARVVPRPLQPIVSRALADDPAERFQSANELGRALRRWSQEQSTPGDAAALAAFLHAQLDAERSTDEERLRSALERVAAGRPVGSWPTDPAHVDGATRVRARTVLPASPTPPSGRLST